jgi:lipopolysaccharide transport system ATP-binding protein
MSDVVISVENLSKRYLIGHQLVDRYPPALRNVLGRELRNFARKTADFIRGRQIVEGDAVEEYWALKDVSFEVGRGEVLGIIGSNGAGKSTLLKILSRITEPTRGRVILRGRTASLLEVGTGFHRELTGRENIFLNGAILGMTRAEIARKFDEIVDFAEVHEFLDTPVKNYSSGMHVRLAFAVAAHLEPEILIVDEVLAVGDAEFQKKCLGKMDEVARSQGRTVLFVSHDMETILRLCSRAILLESGVVKGAGSAKSIVPTYLQDRSASPRVVDLSTKLRSAWTNPLRKARLVEIAANAESWAFPFGAPLAFDILIDVQPAVSRVDLCVDVLVRGFNVITWTNKSSNLELVARPGSNRFRIQFQHLRLLPGRYVLGLLLGSGRGFEEEIPEAVQFDVIPTTEAAEINTATLGGVVLGSATVHDMN